MNEKDTKPEDLAMESEPAGEGEITDLGDTDLEGVAGGNPLILAAGSGEGSDLFQPACGCSSANGAGSGGDCGCGSETGKGA